MFRELAVLLIFTLDCSYALPGKICKVPNADAGTCTPVNECDPLYALHKKRPRTATEDAFYRQSAGSCGSKGKTIKVCCPPAEQWPNLAVSPVIFDEPPIFADHINEVLKPVDTSVDDRINDPLTLSVPIQSENDKIDAWYNKWKNSVNVPGSCGVDTNSDQRIVGGNATGIDEYPWLALLEYEPKQFKCGGSLISRSHVLTAAHCLYIQPTNVRLSEYNLTSEPTDFVEKNGGGKESITVTIVEVQWAVGHPDHEYLTSKNDIGIIKMKQKVDFGYFIKPICLPTIDHRNIDFTVTTKFIVAGWGSDNVYENSEVKRSVFVPYVPMDTCSEQIVTKLSVEQQLCAGGEQGKDSCRGDSGGPLMYEDTSTSNFVIVGIVSSGYGKCGAEGHPGIYTYVYKYVDWIKRTINK